MTIAPGADRVMTGSLMPGQKDLVVAKNAARRRAERIRIVGGGRLVQPYRRSWTNADATVYDIECDGALDIDVSPVRPMILLAAEEIGGRLEVIPGSPLPLPDRSRSKSEPMSVMPAGFQARARSGSMRYCRIFTLELEEEHLRRSFLKMQGPDMSLSARLMFLDARMAKICRLLIEECIEHQPNGVGYTDNLVNALVLAFANLADIEETPATFGGLAPWQLRRVQAFMLENLSRRVGSSELADIAQLSVTHFHRAFKTSAGCAPHQWMIGARLEEAKKLLLAGETAIAEIALSLGFCDQAHFTRMFTKWIGSTPLAWKKYSL